MNETWTQIIVLFLANVALICWFRSESRTHWRQMDNKMDEIITGYVLTIKTIQEEMKDFHTKLDLQDLEFKNKFCEISQKKSSWTDNIRIGK